jgi:hypothetical protein
MTPEASGQFVFVLDIKYRLTDRLRLLGHHIEDVDQCPLLALMLNNENGYLKAAVVL